MIHFFLQTYYENSSIMSFFPLISEDCAYMKRKHFEIQLWSILNRLIWRSHNMLIHGQCQTMVCIWHHSKYMANMMSAEEIWKIYVINERSQRLNSHEAVPRVYVIFILVHVFLNVHRLFISSLLILFHAFSSSFPFLALFSLSLSLSYSFSLPLSHTHGFWSHKKSKFINKIKCSIQREAREKTVLNV